MRTSFPAALAAVALLAACGGSSKSSPPPRPAGDRNIQVSWNANHEKAVNAPGGGYTVSVDGGPFHDVPYVSGALAPTSITTTLRTGSHTVDVWACGALDAAGGLTGTCSTASRLTLNVP